MSIKSSSILPYPLLFIPLQSIAERNRILINKSLRFLSYPFSVILVLVQFKATHSLNKLGKLAVPEILHIKVVILIINAVAQLADPNSSVSRLADRFFHKAYDLFPGLSLSLRDRVTTFSFSQA